MLETAHRAPKGASPASSETEYSIELEGVAKVFPGSGKAGVDAL